MRLEPGALLIRPPGMHRFVLWTFATFSAFVAIAAGGWGSKLIASAIAVGCTLAARRAGRWRPLLDERGWHQGRTTVAWDEIASLALNARVPGDGRIFLRDGTSRPMWDGVETSGPPGWFGADEALARLAHLVAHEAGARPVPVAVVDRATGARRPLDPRCTACETWLGLAA